jgi:hypothetical protein
MQGEARALAESLGREKAGDPRSLAEALTLSLAGHYTAAMGRMQEATSDGEHRQWLGQMCQDVVALSRVMRVVDRSGGLRKTSRMEANPA